jgi:hypothetical protein
VQAEDTVLVAYQRIADELQKVPKASGGTQRSKVTAPLHLNPGQGATGLPPMQRSRIGKLAGQTTETGSSEATRFFRSRRRLLAAYRCSRAAESCSALRSSIAGEQLRSACGHGNRGACLQNLTPGRTFTAQQVLFKD